MRKKGALVIVLLALACASFIPATSMAPTAILNGKPVRIALVTATDSGLGGGAGHWRYYDQMRQQVTSTGPTDFAFLFDRAGKRVRITRGSGHYGTYDGSVVLEPTDKQSFVTWNGKRYRGQLIV